MPGVRLSNSRGKEAGTAGVFNKAQRLGVAGATGERQTDVQRPGEMARGWVTHLHVPYRTQGLSLEVTGSLGTFQAPLLFEQRRHVVRPVFLIDHSQLCGMAVLCLAPLQQIPYPWWLCFEPSGHLL